ncbi:hypothetical protein V6N12_066911 [Hibiscus sabdariffa]|uniref:MULE transposase domain-containing protein n=1 Tax=Hibiscus sabdariffa TaxID=183260 RepID=A0ABR2AXI7_9ROSI
MDNNSKTCVLQYFHGGKCLSSPSFSYVGSSIEKFQVDPDTTCFWDTTGNVKELGYKDDVWVYYRVLGVPFNSDTLVLIHDDNTGNEVVEGSKEVGEGSNKTYIVESSNVQFVGDETREEASADSKDVECEEDVVGEKEVSADSKEMECEEDVVNNEVCSDLDEEVEDIRGKLRASRKITPTESSTDDESDEDNNKDAVEGEYEETNEESDNDICEAYRGKGKKSVGTKYDPSCAFSLWEIGLRHELGVYASYSMCQRARKDVLKKQRASYVEEYANLWGDGNNQLFPFAWEIVEVEGKESWKWFLTKLMEDLGHPNGEGLTLMSEQQKGLVPVINEFFPLLKHRMCARHIYANWHKKWKGLNWKTQFWNCVRSTFVEDFDDQLKILEGMGPTSTNDLLGIPPQHWSHAYFTGESKCDVVDNNLAEAFNGWIVDARCYPIINMLEEIRKMVMQRMHVKRTTSSKWKTSIAPRSL